MTKQGWCVVCSITVIKSGNGIMYGDITSYKCETCKTPWRMSAPFYCFLVLCTHDNVLPVPISSRIYTIHSGAPESIAD